MIPNGMAVSRLNSGAACARAVNAAKLVGRIAHIDSLLTRMSRVAQNEELAGPMMERVLLNDPALSQVLPVAVAKYSAETKNPIPGSLAEASQTLGYPTVRKLVQIIGIAAIFKDFSQRCGLSKDQLLNQAVAVAVGTEFLIEKLGQPSSLAFSAGLFANIGVPAFAIAEPDYQAISASVGGGSVQLHEAEQQAKNFTHQEVGAALLTDYGFPESVCLSAASHANPPAGTSMLQAVSLAESFAHQLGYDGGFAIVPSAFDEAAWSGFHCSENDAVSLSDLVTRWNGLTAKMLS